jgi:hypothetical protein
VIVNHVSIVLRILMGYHMHDTFWIIGIYMSSRVSKCE